MQDIKKLSAIARQQVPSIGSLSVRERVGYVRKLQDLILAEFETLIPFIQNETRKCKTDVLMSEIFPVLDHLKFICDTAERSLRDKKVKTGLVLMGKHSWISFEPMGVVLVISPWNYPFFQALIPCMLSFVCGNATLYKPSEHTPMHGVLEALFQKAGFHGQWIQVVYGDGKVGSQLIDEKPDKIFFTGSVQTGKKIMKQASESLIPVELELGGKDPMIVFDDVTVSRAVEGAIWGGLTHCGQSCTSVERLYVQSGIYDRFKSELLQYAQSLKQGIDDHGETDLGYMTVEFQAQKIRAQLKDAAENGSKILTGEAWVRGLENRKIPPIIVESIGNSSLMQEETFGPVLPLIRFNTEDEVVAMANDSEYGLSASVWSKDLKRAKRVAGKLRVGNVSINNVMLTEGNPYLPFGGLKQSGMGRFKGEMGYSAFCNIKSIILDKDSAKIEANWYPYTPKKFAAFATMMRAYFGKGLLNFLKFALAGMKLEGLAQKARKTPS